MDDEDAFLYGDSDLKPVAAVVQPPVQTSVPQPIPLEQAKSVSQGLVATLEAEAASSANSDDLSEAANAIQEQPEVEGEGEGEREAEEEEEESDDDIEIIMEQPSRSLDLRQQNGRPAPNRNASTSTPARAPPPPTLTTEYTPRERGTLTNYSTPQQPSTQSPRPIVPGPASADGQQPTEDSGPDPSTLPPATAPPSHPSINPAIPGTLDGRSILEVDLAALSEKPWRRPGSDLSDWFNYGFDEISWEAYCYRRRELGEVASVLKNNVLNFAGMPEDQLTALPPEIRNMVIAGSAMMNGGPGGGPGGSGGMMPPGGGMNMNGNPMMGQMMNMPMMNSMMQDMGMTMGGMNGDMAMGMGGGPGMQMAMGGGGGGPGMQMGGQGMMQGEGSAAGGMGGNSTSGAQAGAGGQVTPEGGMGMGDGFGPGVGGAGQGQGQGMMGIAMGGEFSMQQDPGAMGQQMGQQGGQQMFPGVEGNNATVSTSTPTRGGAPGQFRGRGMPPQMPARGRAVYAPRGRVLARPASPLPPNVPTGPRNKTKYRDIDGSAPAVEGLDYGGGGGREERGRGTPDDERSSSRKRRSSPGLDDRRESKRR